MITTSLESALNWFRRGIGLVVCLGAFSGYSLFAGESKDVAATTQEEEVNYTNWITLGIGGVTVSGDEAQFQQRHWINSGWFGGVQDLHWEPESGNKDLTVILDGHAIGGIEDYLGSIEVSYKNVGYLKTGYSHYRTWYDGNGGFFPLNDQFFDLYNNDFSIDRSDGWVELGLRVPNWPEITFRYDHISRHGQKDSTSWGDTTRTGLPPPDNARNIVPTFLDIHETRDIFVLDLKHTLGKTDIGLGVRYEIQDNDNSRNVHRRPGEPTADRYFTQRDEVSADLFSVHVFSETRWNDNLRFTTAYMFTTLDSDIGGSRIYGASYDPVFDPVYARRQQRDEGFLDLMGGSQLHQHVANLNLWWMPYKGFVIIPSLRYEHNDLNGISDYIETNVGGGPGFVLSEEPLQSISDRSFENVTESIEFRYTGWKDWALYARGEWLQEDLNQRENEFEVETGESTLARETDGDIFTQKYVVGANWYPMARLNFSGQYYRKVHENNYDHIIDSTDNQAPAGDRYPAFLRAQDFVLDDVNFRVTWRPCANLTTVTRYDYQKGTIDTRGDFLSEVQSGDMTSHIFGESITWTPLSWLYFQATVHYVLSETDTPADEVLRSLQVAENDYWNGTVSAGIAINEKTDLQLNYYYYRADNYVDNAVFGMPYNSTAEEQAVTATLSREINKHMRASLKYGYFSNRDETSGGHNNYNAHLFAATLQFRY